VSGVASRNYAASGDRQIRNRYVKCQISSFVNVNNGYFEYQLRIVCHPISIRHRVVTAFRVYVSLLVVFKGN